MAQRCDNTQLSNTLFERIYYSPVQYYTVYKKILVQQYVGVFGTSVRKMFKT